MTTINKQISASSDDCTEDISFPAIYLTDNEIFCGYTGGVIDAGLRWQSVNIPNPAVISSATLSVYLTLDTGTLSANIRGIDEDNTATWSAESKPSQRTKTTATINANEGNWGNWGVGNWITISVASVIQEIINRAGWASNNALAIVLEDTAGSGSNYMKFRSWDYSGNAHGAKLDITYILPATKNTRSTMNVHPGVMFGVLTGGHGY